MGKARARQQLQGAGLDPRKSRQFGGCALPGRQPESGRTRTGTVRDDMGWLHKAHAGSSSSGPDQADSSASRGIDGSQGNMDARGAKSQSRKLRLAKAAWRLTGYRNVPPSGPLVATDFPLAVAGARRPFCLSLLFKIRLSEMLPSGLPILRTLWRTSEVAHNGVALRTELVLEGVTGRVPWGACWGVEVTGTWRRTLGAQKTARSPPTFPLGQGPRPSGLGSGMHV